MTTRQYSSRSQQSTLTSAITAGATSITVVSGSTLLGGVSIPAGRTFTLVIDPDTALEEIVDATANPSTNTFTISRAVDGSLAQSHSAGAVVRHMAIGRDFRDANLHAEADASYNDGSGSAHTMHGIAAGEGVVVGTLKTQTLTNKTLTSPTISNPTFTGTPSAEASIVFEGTTADAFETTLTVVDPTQDNTVTIPNTTGTVVLDSATQTLTNKTLTSPTISGSPVITGLSSAGMIASSATPKDYVDSILGSATAAATSAASAATSASSAATSASSAATSASSALTSANSAATSATAAATSATSAAASATAAATSATSAANSVTTAQAWAIQLVTPVSGSDYSAKYNANLAATEATSAATSASSASTSASSALTSANSASTSATSAATSATSSATSASAAATSATSAAASATAAAASATAAAASAASVDATATAATELRQYAAEDSILPNLPARVPVAEGLLRQAAYWVDAVAPTNWGSLGYIRLNGVSGNWLTVPDEAALDITGDIDIRARVSLDDWTPSAVNCIIAKEQTTTTRSYRLQVNTDGTLSLLWTTDGTTLLTASSTVATGVADGSVKWIRATLDVDNGASGKDVSFYLSDNGTTWTQLGTTVTTAGTTSIYSGTSQIGIGSRITGSTESMTGNFYRAQILNGIGGTTVLDVNIATDYKASNQSTFTAFTGQMVTVNGVDTINNLGWTGDLLPTTLGSSTAADSNDPKFLDWTGTNYVYQAGGATQNLTTVPTSTILQNLTGDVDIRMYMAADDWTPASVSYFFSASSANDQYKYSVGIGTTGLLRFIWYPLGTTASSIIADSTVAPSIADGAPLWIRVTLDIDNGAGGNDTKFYTSTNGTTWTQLGSTVTKSGTTSIFAGNGTWRVFENNFPAKFYRAQVMDSIDGTAVLDVDTSVITTGSATSFYALTGQTVTIGRATSGRKTVAVVHPCWLFGTDDYMEVNNRYMSSGTYLYLPGVASNRASAPDAAPLDITGDIDLRVKVALDDWTPSVANALIAKYAPGNRSYYLEVNTAGTLQLIVSTTGSDAVSALSTVATGIADGTTKWVRATLDVDNGASGKTATFYTSDDGSNWTQLGDAVTTAGTVSIFNSTALLEIGTVNAGAGNPARGKFFRAQVLNGINGTVAFDANFETSITSLEQASFTESSANSATVTINRSGSAFRSAGITQAGYLYPGATNTFRASSVNYLDFGTSDSFTFFLAFRTWDTISSSQVLIVKGERSSAATLTAGKRWLFRTVTSNQGYLVLNDGTSIDAGESNVTFTSGAFASLANTVTTTNLQATLNTVTGTLGTRNAGDLENPSNPLTIGGTGASNNTNMELYAVAVWRRALTAGEISSIYTYYAGRVGA